jgi:hypothetical protein
MIRRFCFLLKTRTQNCFFSPGNANFGARGRQDERRFFLMLIFVSAFVFFFVVAPCLVSVFIASVVMVMIMVLVLASSLSPEDLDARRIGL